MIRGLGKTDGARSDEGSSSRGFASKGDNCKKRCLKTVLWAGEKPVDRDAKMPMLCTGPCGMFWSCVES